MASPLEDRLLQYIQETATDGRLLVKLDDLADAVNETKNPVYRALNLLAKKRKIRTENRSKLGIEITLVTKSTPVISSNNEPEQQDVLPIEELSSQIRLLNLNQLYLIRDIVDINIIKKKGDDNNE
jgi:hypothetical protein